MRVFLTGAGGYIGLHIVRELVAYGHEVTAVVRSAGKLGPFAQERSVRVIETDLERDARLAEALEAHDVCVHAALIWAEPGSELDARDTAVAARLFDAAGRAGVRRCLYISSTAVHRPYEGEMGEEDRLHPADVYGATKAAGEMFLRAACAQHEMTGVVLRPGPVVGPPAFDGASCRLPARIEAMVAAAEEARPIDVVRGEGRQLSEVSTVARAVRMLACVANAQPTYLCVDREILTWERVARMVVGRHDAPGDVRVLPRDGDRPVPRFRTDRIEGLLGGPSDAAGALLRQLAARVRPESPESTADGRSTLG